MSSEHWLLLSWSWGYISSRKSSDDKSPFTFHPYVGITWQFTATREGAGVGRMSSVFLSGWKECSQSSVLLRASLGDDSLFSLSPSLCGSQAVRVCICIILVSFRTWVYCIFFVYCCIHGCLSSDFLWLIPDLGCGSWRDGEAVCPLVTSFLFLMLVYGVIVYFLEIACKCILAYDCSKFIIVVKGITCVCVSFFETAFLLWDINV